MAARDRTRRKRGPLAVNNGRLRNFWNHDKSPASTSTHPPSHETKVHNESEDVQPESIQEKERSLRQWSRVLHDQTGTHEPGPSSSVEPPQISVYKFTPSPFPAYGAYINASQGVHVSDGASMPLPQALRVDSLPLEGIAEMESSFGHRQQQEDNFSGSRLSTTLNLGDQTRMAAPTPKKATEPQRLPKKPVRKPIHPDGNNVTPQFVHSKPLDDVINHAEIIRHGSSFQVVSDTLTAGEETTPSLGGADYQFAITPLITQREAPPVSMLNPAAFERAMGPGSPKLTKEVDNETNTVTWVSIPKTTTGLVPPVSQLPMSSPNVAQSSGIFESPGIVHGQLAATEPPDRSNRGHYDITKPTCSLNLVCYRSGAKGCDLQQLHCILRSKFPSSDRFQIVINANKHLVYDDEQFFREMRSLFDIHMSSFVRRWFSLKSHKAFRILAYTPTTRPVVVPLDDFVLQEMMFAYMNPDKVESADDWIQWVFRLRREDKRHAVEFVEGWNSNRIAVAGTIPRLSSCIVGIAWTAAGGDVQSAFTVASFILTSSSIILALLAIISSIESSGRTVMRKLTQMKGTRCQHERCVGILVFLRANHG